MVGINIQAMGSGISQLIMILAAIVKCRNEPKIFFIEEPETNLHPALLRSFMSALTSYDQHQFFITTHSSVVIDAFGSPAKIFRFELDQATSSCRAKECREIVELHSVLDALGVSGSMVLQANCVIWVEGPSDRLYIRKWLTDKYPDLQEGRDHVFLFYGGSALAHLSLDADELAEDELSSLISVARFSALLIDRDDSVDEPGGILPYKQRLCDEAAKDPAHRLARWTDGREIENDVPVGALIKAAEETLAIDLTGCSIGPADSYAEVIATAAERQGHVKASAKKRLKKKVALAQRVIKHWDDNKLGVAVPAYIDEMAAFIRGSRGATGATS
jgi:hypothetical protein